MIRHILSTLALVSIASAGMGQQDTKPQFPQFESRLQKDGDKKLPYRLLIPAEYKPGQSWPLIVWLHGSGEIGTNNSDQIRPIEKSFLADKEKCPAFVMVPQCPPNNSWLSVGLNKPSVITDPSRMVIAAIGELQKEFQLDNRRIYIGGFSMGGCGTWDLLGRYPDLFAAAFPIAGPPGDRKALAPWIKHVPIWVFHGDQDRTAPVDGSRAIVAALKEACSGVKYTEYRGGGHECSRALAEPALREWLLGQKRTTAPDFTHAKLTDEVALIIKTLPEGTRGTWTGKVERTGHGVPRLVIDNTRYRLMAAKVAGQSVTEILNLIGKGGITGECTVTGVVELRDYAWVSVERIEVKK